MSGVQVGSLWPTRVIWALLGAGVTAVIMRQAEPEEGRAAAVTTVESAQVEPLASVTPPPPVAAPSSVITPVPSDAGTTDAGTTDAGTTDAGTTDAGTTQAEPIATVEPMKVPLPLLPGARVMSRSQRHDEERGGEILTLALSVPAPGSQVEAFYVRALTDARMVVSGRSPPQESLGAGHRSSLHGRGREATADVNIKQPAGKLRTVVRIIWRTLP